MNYNMCCAYRKTDIPTGRHFLTKKRQADEWFTCETYRLAYEQKHLQSCRQSRLHKQLHCYQHDLSPHGLVNVAFITND